MARYVDALINTPFQGSGLRCLATAKQVERDLFGREIPVQMDAVPPGREGDRMIARALEEHPERKNWGEIAAPLHGCVVLMHKPLRDHIGVFLDLNGGGVLHATELTGVVFDTMLELREIRGWPQLRFLWPVSE